MFGTASEINSILSGKLRGDKNAFFDGVSTDTRNIKAGQLFIALKGPRYDAHDFLSQAVAAGVRGVIVSKDLKITPKDSFVIKVDDTRTALKLLASYWRNKINPKVIAVTGSCGKTTTKELIFAILSKKARTLKNKANFNNFYGLCQTLLSLRDEKYAVVEVGINNLNEMGELADIAKPHIGVITNIAPVHLEGLKSLRQIYAEKRLLLDAAKDAVFINADDRFLKQYDRNINTITFGKRGRFSFKDVVIRHVNSMVFTLSDREEKGKHGYNVIFPYTGVALPYNVAAAAAIGRYLKADWDDIVEAAGSLTLPGLRMERIKKDNCHIILDAYNANPASVDQAIATFNLLEGKRKTVILGDMRELGSYSRFYHRLLGTRLLKYTFENIVLVGEEMLHAYNVLKEKGKKEAVYYENREALQKDFTKILKKTDLMLIKGSRLMALEKLVSGDSDAL